MYMLNQYIGVGRVIDQIDFKELSGDKQLAIINIAIPRSYKNTEGGYDRDYLQIKTWNAIAVNCNEYLKPGDLIGVKGRIQANKDSRMEVIAEKITFLQQSKSEAL